jgi:4-amino-4-deoxy-L-arabinose transferase-like glycosyltransferase
VAACPRLFHLGHQSLWIDEQFTLTAAGLGGRFAWRDLLDNVHGPLHTLAVAAVAAVGGTSEWVLRLPSALAGIAFVPVMAWLAGRFAGREAMAPAAWLAAASPFAAWYSQECRNYAFVMLASAASTAALLGLHARCRAADVARALALAAAGALSNLSFALLAPLHLRLWLAPGPTRPARVRSLAVAAALAALVAIPWLPAIGGIWDWSRLVPGRVAPGAEAALRGGTTFHPAAIPFALHALVMGYTGGPSLRELRAGPGRAVRARLPEVALAGLVFGTLLALGGRALARRGRLLDALLGLVAPMLVVSYFAAHNFKVFHPRYLAVSLPFVLLALAAAFTALGPRARRGAAVAVGLLWALALGRMAFDPGYAREDYRAALERVRAGFVPGERVLAVGAPEPVEWYGRGLPVSRWWLGFAADPELMAATLEDSLARAPGTWIVSSRPEDLDPEGRLARWLDARVPPWGRWAAGGVSVWHWRRDGAGASPKP